MNKNQKETLLYCLKGNILKQTLNITAVRLLRLLFILYSLSVFYLLIFDTSLIAQIGLYENKYIAAAVCFLAVVVGAVLFVVSLWSSFKKDIKVYALVDNVKIPEFSISFFIKYLSLRLYTFFAKLLTCLTAFLPSIVITVAAVYLVEKTVSIYVFAAIIVCDFVLFFNSVYHSVCFTQKYLLCNYALAENSTMKIGEIVKESSYLMNERCEKLGKYKICHFLPSMLGLIFPQLTVREKASQFLLATDKIIPYARKREHTEKSIVFYFDKNPIRTVPR